MLTLSVSSTSKSPSITLSNLGKELLANVSSKELCNDYSFRYSLAELYSVFHSAHFPSYSDEKLFSSILPESQIHVLDNLSSSDVHYAICTVEHFYPSDTIAVHSIPDSKVHVHETLETFKQPYTGFVLKRILAEGRVACSRDFVILKAYNSLIDTHLFPVENSLRHDIFSLFRLKPRNFDMAYRVSVSITQFLHLYYQRLCMNALVGPKSKNSPTIQRFLNFANDELFRDNDITDLAIGALIFCDFLPSFEIFKPYIEVIFEWLCIDKFFPKCLQVNVRRMYVEEQFLELYKYILEYSAKILAAEEFALVSKTVEKKRKEFFLKFPFALEKSSATALEENSATLSTPYALFRVPAGSGKDGFAFPNVQVAVGQGKLFFARLESRIAKNLYSGRRIRRSIIDQGICQGLKALYIICPKMLSQGMHRRLWLIEKAHRIYGSSFKLNLMIGDGSEAKDLCIPKERLDAAAKYIHTTPKDIESATMKWNEVISFLIQK